MEGLLPQSQLRMLRRLVEQATQYFLGSLQHIILTHPLGHTTDHQTLHNLLEL